MDPLPRAGALTELSLAMRNGQPLGEHFSRLRIWQSRQQLFNRR